MDRNNSPRQDDADQDAGRLATWAERMVPPLAVIAITLAAVLASLMQPRSEPRATAPSLLQSLAGTVPADRTGAVKPRGQRTPAQPSGRG